MRAKISATTASTWQICIIAVALIVMTACSAFAGKAITRIDVTNKSDRTVISVQGNEPLKMMPFSSTAGRYLGFQFPATLQLRNTAVMVRSGAIYCVKYSNYRSFPPCARIVVNTTRHLQYSTEWSSDKTQLQITVWKSGFGPNSVPAAKPVAVSPAEPKKEVKLTVLPPLSSILPAVAVAPVAKPKAVTAPPARLSPDSFKAYESLRNSAMVAKAAAQPDVTSKVLGMVETAQAETTVKTTKRVSLNFLGADINDVLKALSLQSGENIVASKDVKGDVTVSLSNVSMEEALDLVTRPNGLTYTLNNGTYLVSLQPAAEAPVVKVASNIPEIFALHYAKSEDVVAILEKLFPDLKFSGGKKQEGSAGSGDDKSKDSSAKVVEFIAANAPEDRMVEIRGIVKQLEEAIKNNLAAIKTEVYVVKYADPKTLADNVVKLIPGVMVSGVPGATIGIYTPGNVDTSATGGTVVTTPTSSAEARNPNYQSLVLSGPAEQVDRAKELLVKLDVKAPLLNIEAKVTSINKTGEEKLGLKWQWGDKGAISFIENPTERWTRTPTDFSATLEAMVTSGNAQVLASPNLLCLDGLPGVFFVGDEVTYIERIETTPTGQNIKTQTKQVGVQLRVLGDVSPDGYITLSLHPEVSTLKLTEQEGVSLPIVSRRFTDHVVRVKNGQTIAIGGLIRSDEVQDLTKVPLLGDLPFLGKLFQHKSKTKTDNEVVMFITAKVVED